MIIQSKKVWIADQFISAAVELEQGKNSPLLPQGGRRRRGATAHRPGPGLCVPPPPPRARAPHPQQPAGGGRAAA